jgi:hypothetical protein
MRRADAFESALAPLSAFLHDDRVVEILVNPDGIVSVDRLGSGLAETEARMTPLQTERIFRLVASEVRVEVNAQHPSLSAKLLMPLRTRNIRKKAARVGNNVERRTLEDELRAIAVERVAAPRRRRRDARSGRPAPRRAAWTVGGLFFGGRALRHPDRPVFGWPGQLRALLQGALG